MAETQEKEIKIAKVEEFQYGANKEKTGYNIFTPEEQKFSTFSSTVKAEAQVGQIDEKPRKVKYMETEKNGYMNRTISAITDADGNWIESSKSGGGGGRSFKVDPKKQQSIERQNALTNAVNYCTANKISNIDEVIGVAETFVAWTHVEEE